MIERIKLVNDWYYAMNYQPGMCESTSLEGFEKVQLPHTNLELPFHYFDENDFMFISCYKRLVEVPNLQEGQVAKLRFEGVMAVCQVYIDGHLILEHKGGYTPFEVVLPYKADRSYEVTLVVDSREREDVPPFGGQIDYLTYGGVYREVYLDLYPENHILEVRLTADGFDQEALSLRAEVYLKVPAMEEELALIPMDLDLELMDQTGKQVGSRSHKASLERTELDGSICYKTNLVLDKLTEIERWDLDTPNLYHVTLKSQTDQYTTRFGFREAIFKPDGFYLNGKRLQIRGLNRHQSWPYIGYAMPKRGQVLDADRLKYDLNLNLVRTSHYPQSKHFIERCDEIGLLVFEEIPGWQHIGNEAWKELAIGHVEEMVRRDYNNPSIILWGVRVNESGDDHEFYKATNALSRRLDPTRATGGVRYIENSEFLEDVYTMNDFAHEGGDLVLRPRDQVTRLAQAVPYMITEYNGHMYPTKATDSEERLMEHTLRHLRVQNAAYADPDIAGAIGWCYFDYNTHKDFGAGDRICYHGVTDMFRHKKFAAYAYKSQVNPASEPVLMPVTRWARGERAIGGILPLLILTNCDYITVRFGDDEPIRVDRKEDDFSSLPYPPIMVTMADIPPHKIGEWGMKWEDGVICGYLEDREVICHHMAKNPVPTYFEVIQETQDLCAHEKDITLIHVKVTDQYHQVLSFDRSIVKVTLKQEDLGRVVGPSQFALVGGSFACMIETYGKVGRLEVTLTCPGFEPKVVEYEIK